MCRIWIGVKLAPGLTSDKSNVSANLVTFLEYSRAKAMIRNHPMLSKRDRQMHEVGLILIFRCGLRLGELLRLTVSDLILQINKVLLVRNGIYGKTKTRAGIRQIPWLQNLDEDEVALVQDWINHRKVIVRDDPWGALFGTEEEGRILEVRLYLSRVITSVVRDVTGDPTTRIHHLRHGAATNALTLALSVNRESCLTRNACKWFNSIEDDFASEFRERHLGQTMPTRRIVWAISQTLGHRSPRTTLWHYGHSLDLMLYEQVSNLVALKNIQIAQLSGMTQNQLNVAISRNPNRSTASIAQDWLFKNIQGLAPKSKLSDTAISLDIQPTPPQISWITSPKLAHCILTDLSNGFHTDQIASRYARHDIEIQALEASAQAIERTTGYRKFLIVGSSAERKNNYLSSKHQNDLASLVSGHAKSLLPRMKHALEQNNPGKKIEEGVDVWLENYDAHHSGLRLQIADELDQIVQLLKMIDVTEAQVVLAGNSLESLIEFVAKSKTNVPTENLIVRSRSFRSTKRTPLGVIPTISLLFAEGHSDTNENESLCKGGHTLTTNKLHHLMFLTCALLDQRKRLEVSYGAVSR